MSNWCNLQNFIHQTRTNSKLQADKTVYDAAVAAGRP